MIQKKMQLVAGSILLLSASILHASNGCPGPTGIIASPTGNIKQCGGTWTTPIGGQSNWSAKNVKDKYKCPNCCPDTFNDPAGYQWVSTYLTNSGGMNGSSITLTADHAPHTGVAVRLDVEAVHATSFTQVASLNANIVIPTNETSNSGTNIGCGTKFGYNSLWSGTVSVAGCALDFSGCEVNENGWSGFITNGCGIPDVTVGHGEAGHWQSIGAGNTWTNGDQLSSGCHSANTSYPDGCSTTFTTNWIIRVKGTSDAGYQYNQPTYTFSVPTGGTFSGITGTRSSN